MGMKLVIGGSIGFLFGMALACFYMLSFVPMEWYEASKIERLSLTVIVGMSTLLGIMVGMASLDAKAHIREEDSKERRDAPIE